jgi:hypothetical protein
MFSTIRRWHRVLVDRIADWPGLRGRTAADARWAHYERHAQVATATAERHARVAARARDRAARMAGRAGVRGPEERSGE